MLGSSDDLAYFDNSILEPIKDDLIRDTWMHERYGCDGQQQENRTMYYFEYPALVSMLLKDIRYGVQLDVSGVTISPFRAASTAFSFHMGSVDVDYSQESVVMSVPADSSSDTYCSTSYVIRGLRASAQYALTASVECACRAVLPSVTTTADGVAFFFAPAGVSPCKLSMLMI
ncbi:unnamed protein product [Symbiodinium microadriaticum]|nr:unnamed protein product [Symbiodinium microadriaticum]